MRPEAAARRSEAQWGRAKGSSDWHHVAEGRVVAVARRRRKWAKQGRVRVGTETCAAVRCSSLRHLHHPFPVPPCILFFFTLKTLRHRHGRRCFRLDREVRPGEVGAPRSVQSPPEPWWATGPLSTILSPTSFGRGPTLVRSCDTPA